MKKRADGRFVKKITDPKTKKQIYIYGKSKQEINRKLLEYESGFKGERTFKQVADEWWNIEVENLSPSTVKGYRCATARIVEQWRDMCFDDISTSDINRFLTELAKKGFAKKTVSNHKIIINRIFHFAVLQGYCETNPTREAEVPRNLKKTIRHPATVDEEKIIKESVDVWFLPYLALATGMRKGELLGLMWKDIDWDKNVIHVRRSVYYAPTPTIKSPKTEAGVRAIPIIQPLKAELEKRKEAPERYVFGGDKPMSDKAYRYAYQKYQKITGIKATAHQLRKSYATMAVDANVPPDVLKTIIGHRDISTTLNIYAEVRDYRINEAQALIESQFLGQKNAQK